MLPFKAVTENLANGQIVTTLKAVKHNVAIDEKLFGPRNVK
jgi:hypothetical protein